MALPCVRAAAFKTTLEQVGGIDDEPNDKKESGRSFDDLPESREIEAEFSFVNIRDDHEERQNKKKKDRAEFCHDRNARYDRGEIEEPVFFCGAPFPKKEHGEHDEKGRDRIGCDLLAVSDEGGIKGVEEECSERSPGAVQASAPIPDEPT